MEAIILAGGFGTRLSHIVKDVPKPMALVNKRPFLEYILDDLNDQGFTRVILAVGYLKEVIIQHFQSNYKNIELIYSIEDHPLGTGGALKKALAFAKEDDVFVINGDTFYKCLYSSMIEEYKHYPNSILLAVKHMFDFDRYGSLEIYDHKIVEFNEKKYVKEGYINGGIYLLPKNILRNIKLEQFSFEKEVLESKRYPLYAFMCDGYFLDIGIPSDYQKAQEDFKNDQ